MPKLMTLLPVDGVLPLHGAVLSADQRYRYALWRAVPPSLLTQDLGTILAIMLNPSTADDDPDNDDATVRKLRRYAAAWGYTRLFIGNLYALRSRHPGVLLESCDPIGPDNDAYLRELIGRASRVLLAWGDGPRPTVEQRKLFDLDLRANEILRWVEDPYCLVTTASNRPGHPLYLRKSATPIPFAQES